LFVHTPWLQAAKDRAGEKETYQWRVGMSPGGSRRGGERGQFDQQPDGWAIGGGSTVLPRPPPKASDLLQFGKINKSTPSVDLGQSGAPETPARRKKLNLLPRDKPTEEEPAPASEEASEGEVGDSVMSKADAKRIETDTEEFFSVRNLEEAEVYFTNITDKHRFRLVDKFVAIAIESKEVDAQLVGDFFRHAAFKKLCSPASFEEGFLRTAEVLDDIAVDVPKAFDLMAIMMKGANLDEDRRRRIAAKCIESDKLVALLSSS
jgi:translation initiation factor 4G